MKKRYSDEQIIGFLREADAGVSVKDLCLRRGFSEASYYLWRGKYGGILVRLARLEQRELHLMGMCPGQHGGVCQRSCVCRSNADWPTGVGHAA